LQSKSIPGLKMGCLHHHSCGHYIMASTPSTRRKHEESLHFWRRGCMGTKTLNTIATFLGFSVLADTDS
jgi:hypothetical protein